jgi:hypothetical protein
MAWGGGGSGRSSIGTGRSVSRSVKVTRKPTFTPAQKATIKTGSSASRGTPASPTGSKSKVAGWQFSKSDNAYHPSSWFKPVAPKPVAAVRPPVVKTSTGDKGSVPVKKLGTGDKGSTVNNPNSFFNRHSNQIGRRFKQASIAAKTANRQAIARGTTLGGSRNNNVVRGSITRTGGSSSLTPIAKSVATVKPVVKVPAKPVAKVPAKKAPAKKIVPRKFKYKGRGKFGHFKTLRGSGPRHSLSMTPEFLQAAARQRIVNYH